MLISLLKANNNMEISWFSLYESILVLLAYSVEFTLSTRDCNTQFRLRKIVVGKGFSGEIKKGAFLPPGTSLVGSDSHMLKM